MGRLYNYYQWLCYMIGWGYTHDGRADKDSYRHDRRADSHCLHDLC